MIVATAIESMMPKKLFFLKKRMKEIIFAYGLKFMFTLAKMQNYSTLM